MERKSELCPYYDLYHFEDGKLTDYNYLIIAEEVHINTVSDWFKLYQSVVDYFSKKRKAKRCSLRWTIKISKTLSQATVILKLHWKKYRCCICRHEGWDHLLLRLFEKSHHAGILSICKLLPKLTLHLLKQSSKAGLGNIVLRLGLFSYFMVYYCSEVIR